MVAVHFSPYPIPVYQSLSRMEGYPYISVKPWEKRVDEYMEAVCKELTFVRWMCSGNMHLRWLG